jgi:hypothetical protein
LSFSYSELLTTDLDKARARLGDTDSASVLHSDEHIEAVLALEGSLAAGVATLARELVTRFARQPVRIADDGSSVDYSARIPAWQRLAAEQASASGIITTVTAYYGRSETADEYSRGTWWP